MIEALPAPLLALSRTFPKPWANVSNDTIPSLWNKIAGYYLVKKCLRHFMKNLRFFLNLFPSGEGIFYMVKKNPVGRILRLRWVASATCSLPPQCDNCFLPYGKFGEFSYMVKKVGSQANFFISHNNSL